MSLICDIETHTDLKTVRLIGFYDTDTDLHYSWAPEFKDADRVGEAVMNFLVNYEDATIYTWNGVRFDFNILKEEYNITFDNLTHVDGMILHKMMFPDDTHSLAAVAQKFFPRDSTRWKQDLPKDYDDWEEFYNHAPIGDLTVYLEQDLVTTWHVCHKLEELASRSEKKLKGISWDLPLRVEQGIAEITNRQVHKKVQFDRELAEKTWDTLNSAMSDIETRLEPTMPVVDLRPSQIDVPPKKQFLKNGLPSSSVIAYAKRNGFNVKPIGSAVPASTYVAENGFEMHSLPLTNPLVTTQKLKLSQQAELKKYLLSTGWVPTMWNTSKDPVTGRKKKTSPRLADAVSKLPCTGLADIGVHWIPELTEWLMLRSRRNIIRNESGKTGWLSKLDEDDLLASDADTVGTPTARYRHKGIVNVPRPSSAYGKELRSLFRAREGKLWVGWDATALEAVMEAHYTYKYDKDYAIALCEGDSALGTDVHTRNMTAMGLPNRDAAKTFKYAVTYGAEPPRLASQLKVSLAQAERWYDAFWDENKALLALKHELEEEWDFFNSKYLIGLDGRLVGTRHRHALVNTKFQSGGAILMKYAFLIADKTITTAYNEEDAYGLIRYHDEEVWECIPELAGRVGAMGVRSIEKAAEFFKLNVPLTGQYTVGSNWADVH